MNPFDEATEAYIELERQVARLMARMFGDLCGICTVCCCRADICEEALQSAFLSHLLRRQGLDETQIDDRFGWLETNGCRLEYGRPPICYAYYCDQLLERLPNDEARHGVLLLGHLVDHAGRNALGDRHLVEIPRAEDLEKVDFTTVLQRIGEAAVALGVVIQYLETGRLSREGRAALSPIQIREM